MKVMILGRGGVTDGDSRVLYGRCQQNRAAGKKGNDKICCQHFFLTHDFIFLCFIFVQLWLYLYVSCLLGGRIFVYFCMHSYLFIFLLCICTIVVVLVCVVSLGREDICIFVYFCFVIQVVFVQLCLYVSCLLGGRGQK